MKNINYSLREYFEKKYPKQKYKVKCGDGNYIEEEGEWEFDGALAEGIMSETGKLGYKEYNKLKTGLWHLFTPYNLNIYSEEEDYNPLNEKNKVSYVTEFEEHVFWHELIEEQICNAKIESRQFRGGFESIINFIGFTNITPDKFLEDIKNILENYSVKPTKAGEPTKGLNSVASVFMKYIEIKAPPHYIVELRKNNESLMIENMKLVKNNESLMEENIKLVEKEDIRKKVQLWLDNNSSEINFKIGKELYDIIM